MYKNEQDTETLADELEAALDEYRRKIQERNFPPGHPKFARKPGSQELTALEQGQAGYVRLDGPELVKI